MLDNDEPPVDMAQIAEWKAQREFKHVMDTLTLNLNAREVKEKLLEFVD